MDAVVSEFEGEEVVVEELILVGFAIGSKQDFAAIGRPVNRVLIEVAVGELANLFGRHLHGKDVQALVVVEAGEALTRGWLVEITGDHDRVAVERSGRFTRRRGDERDLLSVGRPGDVFSTAWQG